MCTGTALFFLINYVLGGVLIPDEKKCASSVDGNLAAAVRPPGVARLSRETNATHKLLLTTFMFPLPMLI